MNLSNTDARKRFAILVVASLGVMGKGKSNGQGAANGFEPDGDFFCPKGIQQDKTEYVGIFSGSQLIASMSQELSHTIFWILVPRFTSP